MADLDYLLSKLGPVNPATRSKAIEIINAAERAGFKIRFVWGYGTSGEHKTGNALDIMVYSEAAGDFVRNYVWANRARLRLRHVIWEQHITSTVTSPGVRRPMADRGSVTENHYDHNHIWFLDANAYVPPPTSTSKPPASAIPALPATGTKRPSRALTKSIQEALELSADGLWGGDTDTMALRMRTAARCKVGYVDTKGVRRLVVNPFYVSKVQSVIDTKVDKIWGPNSQTALIAWIKDLQRRIGVTADGQWGPITDAKFLSIRYHNLNQF
jgi:hypothetical protein